MKILSLLLCAALILSGCGASMGEVTAAAFAVETTSAITSDAATAQEEATIFSNRDLDASYSESESIVITLNGNEIVCDNDAVKISGNTAAIQKEGTYLLSGTLKDGFILVDGSKTDIIQLVLNGVSIHSDQSAPIYVRQADKVFVTLADGSENRLSNGGTFTPDGDTNIDAVIFSREDLTINGSGTLSIISPIGHGIVSKDSLRITGGTYIVDAASHGLCGKDEVSIFTGNFDITAGKDGIHAENGDDTDAGTVYLESGTFQIATEGDGISASGCCHIVDGDYNITAGGGSENAQQSVSDRVFGGGQRESRKSDEAMGTVPQQDGQGVPNRGGERKGGIGGRKGFDRMSQKPSDVQSTAVPTEETNSVSAKGIKTGSLVIDGGSFTIDAADDGLHADGNLTLQGGALTISSGDDGLHADETVMISAGSINILKSYEGIEGNHVMVQGGEITLTAIDDGLNAAGGRDGSGFGMHGDSFNQSGDTSSIVISGGTVNVTASGDGIDANGTLEISSGTVTVSGSTYGDTSVLDYDLSGIISGGTFIGTGSSSMAQTFSESGQGVISVNAGSQNADRQITLADSSGTVILSYTPALSFEIVILSDPSIHAGESCTLSIGSSTQIFTAK